MMPLRVIFFLVLFFCLNLSSSSSQIIEPDSSSATDRRIDSLQSQKLITNIKSVPQKTVGSDETSKRFRCFETIVIIRDPADFYRNAFYLGAIIDINGQKMKNGKTGVTLQYKRLQKINKTFGINFLSSLTIFYNASEDRYYASETSEQISGSKSTENYFTFNLHLAPSISTSTGELIYAGLGVTYLKGRIFQNSMFGPISVLAPYNERELFSQIIGIEQEVTPELCLNLEYQHTEYNDFFSFKLGMRF